MKFFSLKKDKANQVIIYLAIFILLIFASVLLCSCSNSENNSASIKITDLCGREVSLEKPAENIIVFSPSDCEILCAMGEQNKIIGRGSYCNYPEDINSITDFGAGETINTEEIIRKRPDAVILTKMGTSLDTVKVLENSGIPTIVNQTDTINDIYTSIENIGKICKNNSGAKELSEKIKSKIESYETKLSNTNVKYNAYVEISPLEYGLWTAGSGTFITEILDILKINNVFSDLNQWAQISQEEVIKRDPNIIFSMYGDDSVKELNLSSIRERQGWSDMQAIKDNKIYHVDELFMRPSIRLIDALDELYNIVYG